MWLMLLDAVPPPPLLLPLQQLLQESVGEVDAVPVDDVVAVTQLIEDLLHAL